MTRLSKLALFTGSAALVAGAGLAQQAAPAGGERAMDEDMQTSLYVTVGQIDDADVIGPNGEEFGEVEAVLLNDAGEPAWVLVELEDDVFDEERLVRMDLGELTTREDDDWVNLWDEAIELVTDRQPDEIAAMSTWTMDHDAVDDMDLSDDDMDVSDNGYGVNDEAETAALGNAQQEQRERQDAMREMRDGDAELDVVAEETEQDIETAAAETGQFIENAAEDTGQAIATAANETGEAIDNAADETGEELAEAEAEVDAEMAEAEADMEREMAQADTANFQRATDLSQQTTLGVTVGQINDADLIGANGEEFGEVEAVLLNDAGEPASVLVELEDDVFEEERLVEVDLAGLTTREDDDFINLWDDAVDLVTDRTAESFEGMNSWRYAGPTNLQVDGEESRRAEADVD